MLRKVLLISFLLNIILILSLLFVWQLGGHFDREKTKKRPSCNDVDNGLRLNVSERQFCFSCNLESSVQVNETLYSGILQLGNNNQLCCANIDRNIRELLSKVLRHQEKDISDQARNTAAPSPWFVRKSAIHTRLAFSANREVIWLADGEESSFQNGVSLIENRLRVQKEGRYFIYAAVTHYISKKGVVETFYHMISKRHRLLPKNGHQTLLMDKTGGRDMRSGLYTSFLCGSFDLKEGHEISIHISKITIVDTSVYSNYFGMFIL